MTYYKVKNNFDQTRRCDGSILIANELYTPGEMKRYAIPTAAVDAVEISKRHIYFFFGARFETGVKN